MIKSVFHLDFRKLQGVAQSLVALLDLAIEIPSYTQWEEAIETLHGIKQNTHQNIIMQTKQQLTEYFEGRRKKFVIPYALKGSPFQMRAWQTLCTIHYGQTISYTEQAMKLGNKNKARAVGMANALNPIPIILPCHRVIGKNGQLTGFAGGIDKKQYLLALETQNSPIPHHVVSGIL